MDETFTLLRQQLDAARSGQLPVPALAANWRAQARLLAALPPRYGEVLEQLLTQLESGSLFTEESCSFSQKDLLDSMGTWLEKAQATLRVA